MSGENLLAVKGNPLRLREAIWHHCYHEANVSLSFLGFTISPNCDERSIKHSCSVRAGSTLRTTQRQVETLCLSDAGYYSSHTDASKIKEHRRRVVTRKGNLLWDSGFGRPAPRSRVSAAASRVAEPVCHRNSACFQSRGVFQFS